MKTYKEVLRFSGIALKESFRSVIVWIVFLAVFMIIRYFCNGCGEYLCASNERMNLFEIYIWFNSGEKSHMIYIVGIMVLVCGIIFFQKGAPYYLLRMNKKIWVCSQIVYLFVLVFALNILILVAVWVSCNGQICLSGKWSDTAFAACQFGVEDIGISSVIQAYSNLLPYNPNMIGMVAFFQQILIGMVIGMVLMAFQAKGKVVIGFVVILVCWFGEVMFSSIYEHPVLNYLTPFRMATPSQIGFGGVGASPVYAFCYLLVLCIVLESFLMRISKQVDFLRME